MPDLDQFDDETAMDLLEDAANVHLRLTTELKSLGENEKSAIWRKITDLAALTARELHCKTSDVIWGTPAPASPVRCLEILAAIRRLFKRVAPPLDHADGAALLILRTVASISYAEALAGHEGIRMHACQLKQEFGNQIDEILYQE